MLTGLQLWRRTRQLAGDERAGAWARGEARRLWWHFVRRQWRLLGSMIAVAGTVTTLIAVFIPGDFQRGLVVGGATVGTVAALAALIVQATGTAAMSMGATAEQWTASELRMLRKSGWHIVNHVALQRWDIDHVLVGPGGVIAVETKWSGAGWRLDPPSARVREAATQVRNNARDLRLWHPLRSLGIDSVTPVVFLWGGSRPATGVKPRSPVRIDDVDVIYGVQAARAWRSSIKNADTRTGVEARRVRDMWSALDDHLQRRDSHEEATAPPPSLLRLYWTGAALIATAALAALISITTLVVWRSWWLWSLTTLLFALIGVATRRARRLHLLTIAWLAGLSIATIYIAAVVIRHTIA